MAAKRIMDEITLSHFIDSVNTLQIDRQNSIITDQKKQIDLQQKDIECLKEDNQQTTALLQVEKVKTKKETRKWKAITGGSIVIVILSIIF